MITINKFTKFNEAYKVFSVIRGMENIDISSILCAAITFIAFKTNPDNILEETKKITSSIEEISEMIEMELNQDK